MTVEGTDYELGPNTFMWIPPNEKHGFTKIIEHAKILEIYTRIDIRSDLFESELPFYEEYPDPRPLIKV